MTGDPDYISVLLSQLRSGAGRTVITEPCGRGVTAQDLAQALQRAQDAVAGCAPGALPRFATLLPNDWQAGAVVLGLASKASVLPLNPGLKTGALAAMVAESQVDMVIGAEGDPRGAQLGVPMVSRSDLLAPSPAPASPVLPSLTPASLTPPSLTPRHAATGPELLLTTSGSTGAPKRVALPPAALLNRAQVIAKTLTLGPGDRALHALPMFHIGAFVDLLLAPLIAGGTVALTQGQGASALWQALGLARPTWIQLVPTMLQAMLRQRPAAPDLAELRLVRTVSSGLTAELQAKAEAVFGCPVIQMYGMTETAGQICSNPLPDAPRKPLSVGPPTEIDLEIRDSAGKRLDPGKVGEVFVKGPSVIARYDSAKGLGTAWLSTGDMGWQDSEGYVFLTGRAKEQINRGGEKISPLVIEQAARAVPGVEEAAAYAVPHPSLGESVGLAVVISGAVSEAAILGQIANHLAPFEMPRMVQELEALPRLPGGKLDRRALAAAHQERSGQDGATKGLSPADQRVADLWSEILEAPQPSLATDFFDAGGDSLAATTFILRLEEMLGHPVSPNILFDHPTFGALLDALAAPLDQPAGASGEARAIHYAKRLTAGWGASLTRPDGLIRMVRPLDDRAPFFWCCQGFDEAEHAAAWIMHGGFYVMPTLFRMKRRTERDRDDLADALAAELQRLYPTGPLVVGGFCEGARMMARIVARLERQGRAVRAFLSVDHRFEASVDYPVLHVTSRNWMGYPNAAIALPDLHRGGFEAHQIDLSHDDISGGLHALREVVLPFLTGERVLAQAKPRATPPEARSRMYRARIRARLPWRWRAGRPADVQVALTNKSAEPWPPSAESGLIVQALEANARGAVVDRFLGHAAWDRAIQPGETRQITLPVTLAGPSRAMVLCLQLADQGVADLSFRSGGLALYPRFAVIGG